MALTASQLDQLHRTLLDAFRRDDLRRLLRTRMEVDFDHVAAEKAQRDQVWELACWADREGRAVELAQVAAADKPANPSLQALLTAAQTWDPAPAPPTAEPRTRSYLWVNVPPKPVEPLLGRDELLTDLIARLTAGHSPALSTDGLPGVGKTALAVALAHDQRIRTHFAGGVLWAGLGTQPDVITAQNQWATALGIDLSDEPDGHRRLQRLSGAVGERRVLVVIDDAWDAEPPKMLRLSSPYAVHLLTSRDRTIARAFAGAAQQVHVPELAPDPAFALLQRLAPEACAADPAAARALVQPVGELPLAIEVVGGFLAEHELTVFPGLTPDAFGVLGDARQRLALDAERLGGMSGKRDTLEAVIRLSVEALETVSPQAVAAFWALGAFAPKPATFDRAAAEAVTGVDAGVLKLLVDRNLVEGVDGGLAVHQVVHDVMGVGVAGAVRERHAQFYLSVTNENKDDWLRIESIYPQVKHAWSKLPATDVVAIDFVNALETYQTRRALWVDRLNWLDHALKIARSIIDVKSEANILNEFGFVYSALGDKRQALDYYEQALPMHRQAGNRTMESATLNNIGLVYSDLGDKGQALDYYQQSLMLSRQVGDKGGEAATLNNIGLVYSALGDKRQALDYYQQALPLSRQVGDKGDEATTLNNIGLVYNALGDKRQALDYYQQALPMYRQVGNRTMESITLNNIGSVYSDLGDKDQALDYYEQSLLLSRQVGDKGGEAVALNNIGLVYDDLGEKAKALAYYEQSLPLQRQVGDKSGEATTLNNVGSVYDDLGEKDKALAYYEQALPLRRQVGDRWGESVTRHNIAIAAQSLGDLERAETELLQVVAIDEAVGHPDLASDRAMLERVLRERQGG